MNNIKFEESKVSFYPDKGLMYLIQSVTKHPSDEILGFFFDFGKAAIVKTLSTIKKQRSFKRTIENYYPNTAIPFTILVQGTINKNHPGGPVCSSTYITVSFPENREYIDTKVMMEAIMEKHLLGGSHMPDFKPPETFASNGFKDLVKDVLGKK